MAQKHLTICYVTKKPNAIASLAATLRIAFPKLTASQVASTDEMSTFKDVDLVIADSSFQSITASVPILYVIPQDEAAKYINSAYDFITEEEITTFVVVRAIKNLLERKRLVSDLKEASIRDELTGLYNQRFISEALAIEVKKAIRYGYPLTLLYMGLDNSRKTNATYSHKIGDRVITDFGLIATNSLRCVDTVGRYYGDEFLAILPETTQTNSAKVCERIQNATKNFAFANGEPGLNVTVSIGIASLSTAIRTPEELLDASRTALSGAKKKGVNGLCTFEDAKLIDEPARENRELIVAVGQQILMLTEEAKKAHYNGILKLLNEIPLYKKLYTHSEHVAFYAERLATKMGLSSEELATIRNSAILHDIGKLAIDERLVLKNGPLSSTEYAIIKQHPVFGAQMLSESSFVKNEINTILHHHEFFDGNGYPDHMRGTYIPLSSRIISLAESWDVMISPQSYRSAMPLDQALNELKSGAGKQFDPELVAIFTGLIEN